MYPINVKLNCILQKWPNALRYVGLENNNHFAIDLPKTDKKKLFFLKAQRVRETNGKMESLIIGSSAIVGRAL